MYLKASTANNLNFLGERNWENYGKRLISQNTLKLRNIGTGIKNLGMGASPYPPPPQVYYYMYFEDSNLT